MAQKVSPSLIFVNPDETGLDMCRTIRGFESLQKVPIVLLTSSIGGIDPGTAEALGVSDVLNVPFTAAELLEKTAKILDTKAPIVLHVKEKSMAPESEETAFSDFFKGPDAQQGSGIEPQFPQTSWIKDFDEEPDGGSGSGKEEGPELTDAYIPRGASRRRKNRNNFPVVIAGVVILVVGIAAGALFYLGLIPGIGTKKDISVKPLSTAVKPKAQSPAPAPSSTPSNKQQQETVAENKTAPAPSSSDGKAAPAPSSPTPLSPVKKEASPPSGAAPAPSANVQPTGETVYAVQIGVFKSEGNAAALTKEFKCKGYDAFMVKGTGKDKGTFYRVLIGKSADRKESAKLAAKIRDKEKIKTVVYAE